MIIFITVNFNFRLLSLYFIDFYIILPYLLFFSNFWIFFLKNNFFNVRINPSSKDTLKNSKFLKKVHYNFLINWLSINFLFFFISFIFIKIDGSIFWFNHLKLNNFLNNIIFLIILLTFFIINLIKFLKTTNVNYSIDYFSSIINLMIFVPLIFLSNTMYTFIFMLELNSLLILYKFSVSRNWFEKNNYLNKNNTTFDRLLPKSYMNMIFFQYWANFFSSMLIIFSSFSILYIYGSTEWKFINFINYYNSKNYIFNNLFMLTLWISFFIGMFFKIGFTPLHLFKIEVYKGIPFISIFFYTTFYFLSFFLYFIIIIFYNFKSFNIYWNIIMYIFIIFGLFYTIFLLFDVNLIKSFFAYSTVVNVLSFMIVVYLILN